ncbi:MAG: acyltransferase [Parvularculaceae bacterium]|nr:acyltransferase [Parvularculaceae bacterium]
MTISSFERFLELDACRGIAALVVALAHLTLHYDLLFGFKAEWFEAQRLGDLVFLLSRLPVYFFFLISGFVIGLTLLNVDSMRQFAIFRFARLFPAYWAAVILTSLLLSATALVGKPPTGSEIALNMTMIQPLIGVRGIDPVYWSLTYELVFYALIIVCFARLKRTKETLAAFAALWLMASSLIWEFAPDFVKGLSILEHLFKFVPFFTGGIAFFLWRHDERGMLVICLIVVSAMVAATRVIGPWHPSAFLVFGLFYLAVSGRAPMLRSAPFLFLGKISYPLYLFHLAPGYLIVTLLDRIGAPTFVSIACATAVLLFCAFGLHVTIEAPARRVIRNLAMRRPAHAAA